MKVRNHCKDFKRPAWLTHIVRDQSWAEKWFHANFACSKVEWHKGKLIKSRLRCWEDCSWVEGNRLGLETELCGVGRNAALFSLFLFVCFHSLPWWQEQGLGKQGEGVKAPQDLQAAPSLDWNCLAARGKLEARSRSHSNAIQESFLCFDFSL